MDTPTPSQTPSMLDPTTRLGYVRLTVANLERQIQFYTQVLGFTLHWHKGAEAVLGTASEVLLRLSENPAARRMQHTTGMYHFAILYPSRKDLARAIARLFAMRYPNSPTDHGVSKTTYLDDLEGNTIELYVRSLDDAVFDIINGEMVVRYADGRIGTGRDPLDLEALFSELAEDERLDTPLPEGTRLGHMHLYVSSLDDSMNFYARILGYQEGPLITNFRMGEVGLDEQQPHVVAFNTWKGEGIPSAPDNALGIQYFTIVPTSAEALHQIVERVQKAGFSTEVTPEGIVICDPSGIKVIVTEQMLSLT